jgi:hypothetical protein
MVFFLACASQKVRNLIMNAHALARLTRHILYYGEEIPTSEPIGLRAGPLSLCFDQADVRRIRLGNHEVIRRIYVAVRDQYWNTVPTRFFNLRLESSANSFRLTFEAEHVRNEIDFYWKGSVEGNADGTIRFVMDGEARSSFLSNRVGICILHPIAECAGRSCTVEHIDGSKDIAAFPLSIAPHQPFMRMRSLSYEVLPGLPAEMSFAGDTFETEDQRNWSDASYKTYCPPLEIPFPVQIQQGKKVRHSVTLTLRGTEARISEVVSDPALAVALVPAGQLPAIGLGMASHGESLSEKEMVRLAGLHLSHLRVDMRLSQPDLAAVLDRATAEARSLQLPLEVAIFMSDAAAAELTHLIQILNRAHPPISRWLVFHVNEWSTSEKWVKLARSHLSAYNPEAQIGAGSNIYFAELNRKHPRPEALDFICYPVNPQVHASDRTTLVENLEAQGSLIKNAKQLSGGLPVAVTPVTLKPRLNPAATAVRATRVPEMLPANVDVRQMSLFAAGWTIGSMKQLAEQGALSVTYFETTGWCGVMEREKGSPRPDVFRSLPGSAFPMYFAFFWVGEFAGGFVLPTTSTHPLKVQGLGFCKNGKKRVLLANLEASNANIRVSGLGARTTILRLNETNAIEANLDPEKFGQLSGDVHATVDSGLRLELLPFEIVRIDFA